MFSALDPLSEIERTCLGVHGRVDDLMHPQRFMRKVIGEALAPAQPGTIQFMAESWQKAHTFMQRDIVELKK